jgi:hypothetical protein
VSTKDDVSALDFSVFLLFYYTFHCRIIMLRKNLNLRSMDTRDIVPNLWNCVHVVEEFICRNI